MKKYTTAVIVVVALAIIIAFLVTNTRVAKAPPGAPVCPQDTKVCPDGSQVGRAGFSCEFAKCPQSGSVPR